MRTVLQAGEFNLKVPPGFDRGSIISDVLKKMNEKMDFCLHLKSDVQDLVELGPWLVK